VARIGAMQGCARNDEGIYKAQYWDTLKMDVRLSVPGLRAMGSS